MTDQSTDIAHPEIRRMRHELKRRSLTVERVERLTPHMIRVHLTGADLAGFVSAAFDDHLKVFLPRDGAEPDRRDYTPRRYDAAANRLLLDFVDHDAGPAAEWARGAQAGDTLEIAGPRGSAVIAGDIAQWLLIGDETALPAIGRQVEELRQGPRVTSIVAVPGPADEQRFESAAEHRALWLHRPAAQATDPAPYLAALDGIDIAPGTFVWIAAEAGVARAIRDHLTARGHPLSWLKAAGYWIAGQADASDKSLEG
ncbi:siderophore-interacting protein [Seohaeicola zhoushanensis]|uniref:Siderophore-interacting protein n=1 Tax=Seohaeicola zhoushanensis TaxID=1569283 RepID=A0A8J3MAU1_9RHOB|nr:siderophore-interacting protein [Seohaeicola zhoushanensis]GHF72721.1 siderophore-interacting protein [Seohaeicola zhoushanensis]